MIVSVSGESERVMGPTDPRHGASLVGRDRELATLRDRLTAALDGRGSLVLVSGEAGIGKTARAEALCAEAAVRGARTLIGRCYDLAETPPYGPWIEALAHLPRSTDLPPLPNAHRTDARGPAQFFAEVRDFFAAATASRPEAPQPLVVLLEDLHWADSISLDLLRFLARSLLCRCW
jgi:predicted ATPase